MENMLGEDQFELRENTRTEQKVTFIEFINIDNVTYCSYAFGL